MYDYNIDAPDEFYVSSFSPVEHEYKDIVKVEIGGIKLDQVKRVFVKGPDGAESNLKIESQNTESLCVSANKDFTIPENSMFFIILAGDNKSWYPIGPMIRLRK
jgi:hypothetical protein